MLNTVGGKPGGTAAHDCLHQHSMTQFIRFSLTMLLGTGLKTTFSIDPQNTEK